MAQRKDPENLKEIHSLKITDELRNFVNDMSTSIMESKSERAYWDKKIDDYINLRYGIRQPKTHPWPNCANYSMPLIDAEIARSKPSYVNLLNVTPLVNFEPYGPEDIEPARMREHLFDWLMKTKVEYFEPYCLGVDYLLSQGATIFKIGWKFSTRSYYKRLDISDLPEEVIAALYDARMDDEYLKKIIIEELNIDDGFVENLEEVDRVVKEFRKGEISFELNCMEVNDDQPELTACSLRDDITFPVDTYDLNDARFIDYTFTRSKNDLKIAIKDGRYEKYTDQEIESWQSNPPMDRKKGAKKSRASRLTQDDSIWLHETCVWYDIDNDGIEERCIVTWPDADPSAVLRFIELPYDHGMWPYVLVKRELNDPGAFSSRGLGALNEDFQNAISTFINQSVDNGTVTNTPMVKYKRGALSNIKNVRYVPGQSIEMTSNINDMTIESIGNNTQGYLFQAAQYFKSWADQRSGNLTAGITSPNNNPGQGQGGNRTKKEIDLVEGLSSQVQSLDLQVFQQQMAGVYYQINALWDQFGSDEVEILITGQKPLKVSRYETQGKFNMIPNGKLDNSNPELRANKAFNLMKVFINDPMINQRELKELFLADYDIKLSRLLLKSEEQMLKEQQQAMMAQEIAKGQAVNTQLGLKVVGDNLEVRKAALLQPIEGAKFKEG